MKIIMALEMIASVAVSVVLLAVAIHTIWLGIIQAIPNVSVF